MKLTEIFTQLSTGEFKQLGIGGVEEGGIYDRNQYEVIQHLNLALTELHKRFNLKVRKHLLTMLPGTVEYTVTPTGADLLKVIGVWNQDGDEMSLNEENEPDGVFTPDFNKLTVPTDVAALGGQLTVKFRAGHAQIAGSPHGLQTPTLDATEISLPRTHLRALLLFMAARAHAPTGMVNEFNAGNNYLAQFEAECALLDGMNLQVDAQAQTGHDRFRRGGWI